MRGGEGGAEESGVIASPFLDWKVEEDIGRAPKTEAVLTPCDDRELREGRPTAGEADIGGDKVEEDATGDVNDDVDSDMLSNY